MCFFNYLHNFWHLWIKIPNNAPEISILCSLIPFRRKWLNLPRLFIIVFKVHYLFGCTFFIDIYKKYSITLHRMREFLMIGHVICSFR